MIRLMQFGGKNNMSTMKCPDCGRKISSRTTFNHCPHCGCPMSAVKRSAKFKSCLTTLGVIAVISLLCYVQCEDNKKPSRNKTVKHTTQIEKVSTNKSNKSEKYENKKSNKVGSYNEEVQDIIKVEEPVEENNIIENSYESSQNNDIPEISFLTE